MLLFIYLIEIPGMPSPVAGTLALSSALTTPQTMWPWELWKINSMPGTSQKPWPTPRDRVQLHMVSTIANTYNTRDLPGDDRVIAFFIRHFFDFFFATRNLQSLVRELEYHFPDEASGFSLFLALFEDETRNSSEFWPFPRPLRGRDFWSILPQIVTR